MLMGGAGVVAGGVALSILGWALWSDEQRGQDSERWDTQTSPGWSFFVTMLGTALFGVSGGLMAYDLHENKT